VTTGNEVCSGLWNLLYNPGSLTTSDRPDEPPDTHSGVPPFEAFTELLRLLAAARPTEATPGPGTPNPQETAARPVDGDAVRLVGQVMVAWAASGLRSWARTVEIWGKALPLVVDALAAAGRPNGDPAEKARRSDELRASLRELAELPGRESQRLQVEIERIVFGVGSGAGPQTGSDKHWRRWEAKP
jgi:hypothetical protein